MIQSQVEVLQILSPSCSKIGLHLMFRTIFGSFIETAAGKKKHIFYLSVLLTIHQYGNKSPRLEEVQDAWRPPCSCASALVSAGPSIMTPFGR